MSLAAPTVNPLTDDIQASQNGRFLTNDGRVFFSTSDPLVPRDTNAGVDVYEYVDGRPQRGITPGTGVAQNSTSRSEVAGLVGVSADGADVYLATYDTYVDQDHNRTFLKFYDARAGGGFVQPAPSQPCNSRSSATDQAQRPPIDRRRVRPRR